MTAAGLAFIAGGLATLISFRAVLFGAGDDGADDAGARRPRRETTPRSRPQPEPELFDTGSVAGAAPPARAPAGERSMDGMESWNGEPSFDGTESWSGEASFDGTESWSGEASFDGTESWSGEVGESSRFIDTSAWRAGPPEDPATDDSGTLPADTDFSYDVPCAEELPYAGRLSYDGDLPYAGEPRYADPVPPPRQPMTDRSDRINGWVRPHYPDLDDRPPAGDYWTPVPDDLYADPEPSARGYGWPVRVERLPAAPAYEPSTGFDLTPVQAAEPTTLVPTWPPPGPDRQVRPARAWGARDEGRTVLPRSGEPGSVRTGRNNDESSWTDPARRSRRDADPARDRERGPRPRPRPRPVAAAEPDAAYRSRHSR
ncbi:hypothetical protein Apa02nite_012670 [Actinoplanes palleronii]|uniref:Uncharacterized protein n=2 Tax=Actinoplanes palleronii TaxID=113570 RepID=A0ABQ4B3B4_9ACTN|nr:hypothetical protein Apa02nite_012670 [Actinoplanes palleronii]